MPRPLLPVSETYDIRMVLGLATSFCHRDAHVDTAMDEGILSKVIVPSACVVWCGGQSMSLL